MARRSPPIPPTIPLSVRFWAKVDKDGPVPSHAPELGRCWVWTASRHRQGYGHISIARGQQPARAHRVAWEFENGPIPPGMRVLHHCDNPPCVRPSHLFLGTDLDNEADKIRKGRRRLTAG